MCYKFSIFHLDFIINLWIHVIQPQDLLSSWLVSSHIEIFFPLQCTCFNPPLPQITFFAVFSFLHCKWWILLYHTLYKFPPHKIYCFTSISKAFRGRDRTMQTHTIEIEWCWTRFTSVFIGMHVDLCAKIRKTTLIESELYRHYHFTIIIILGPF